MRRLIAAFLVCAGTVSLAGRRVGVAELETIIRTALAGGKQDSQIAASLATIELTERLTDAAQQRLLESGCGPRTRDVLAVLGESSIFLDPPAAERVSDREPTAAAQAEIVAKARQYSAGDTSALPNFICTRVTRRFDDHPDLARARPEVWGGLRLRDSFLGQMSVAQGLESYVDATGAASGPAAGFTTSGEFGSALAAIWRGAGDMTWVRWEALNGVRVAVFRYSVEASRSNYRVSFCCPEKTLVSAYRGELFVAPSNGAVLRITRHAEQLPDGFPTRAADTAVDYGPMTIGGQTYMLPTRSVTMAEALYGSFRWRLVRYLNDVRFVRYHKFNAESRLVADPEKAASEKQSAETDDTGSRDDRWMEAQAAEEGAPASLPPPSPPAEAAAPQVTIRTAAQLVEVPVVVRDRKGVPVTGLKPEDFEIYDNGKRREIGLFLADAGSAAGAAQGGAPPVEATPEQGRIVSNMGGANTPNESTVILVDQINTEWTDLAYARSEIIKVLASLPAGGAVGVYTMGWGSFTILSELTRDSAALARLFSTGKRRYDLAPAFSGARDVQFIRTMRSNDRSGTSAEVLRAVARHLAAIPGRKNLILVSPGFPVVRFPEAGGAHTGMGSVSGEAASWDDALAEDVRFFNDANVAVYAVDAAGLQPAYPGANLKPPLIDLRRGNPMQQIDAFARSVTSPATFWINARQTTLLELSSRTGGRTFLNANDVAGAIRTALEDTRGSYRLGYYANDLTGNSRYHRIEVRLATMSGIRLRYRRGYFDSVAPNRSKAELRDVLAAPINAVAIPVSAELKFADGRYSIELNVGLGSVRLKAAGGRWKGTLEFGLAQRDEDGTVLDYAEQKIGLNLKDETFRHMSNGGFGYTSRLTQKARAQTLRVAVRDVESGAAGSVSVPF